jgi:beta-1,4-mannosyltransferase
MVNRSGLSSDMKVVFLSNWLTNPYKRLLADNLARQGTIVEEYLWQKFFMPLVLQNGKPDIVHLHTLHPFVMGKNMLTRWVKVLFFVAQLFCLRLLGVQTIWTVHEWSNKLGNQRGNIAPVHAAILGKFLAGVVAHCQSTATEIARVFELPPERIFVIPHGNYIDSYENTIARSTAREKLGLPPEATVFLLFGEIYRYKGVLPAIESFKQLADSLPVDQMQSVHLIVAGMPREQALEADINAAIADRDNIHFVPQRIADADVQLYMNASDCVLVPYQVFTTSGIAILAMSFGKACIAPDSGFFKDVFDPSRAFLYDPSASDGLYRAIAAAYEQSDQLAAMGDRNYQLAQRWSWQYVAKQTIAAYQACKGVEPELADQETGASETDLNPQLGADLNS